MIELFESGAADPSIDAIAERAGVSNRSVYRYFDDRDDLIRTAVRQALGLDGSATPPSSVDPDRPLAERIGRFVADRLDDHHESLAIVRAARLSAATEPLLAEQFAVDRSRLRERLLDCFGPELDRFEPGEAATRLVAIELLLQFDSIDFLLLSTDGRRRDVTSILVEQLTMQLGASVDRGTPVLRS